MGFDTLERSRESLKPSSKKTKLHKLHALIDPHLSSFDAIKSVNNGSGPGLLKLCVSQLDKMRLVDNFGNDIECRLFIRILFDF